MSIPILIISWSEKRPLFAFLYDKDKDFKKFIPLWMANTGLFVKSIIESEKVIKLIVKKYEKIIITDYKKFLDYFGYDDYGDIYDYPGQINNFGKSELIKFVLDKMDDFGKEWQLLRGRAALVYHKLEKTGIINEYKLIYPKYKMETFSGRSSTTTHNVQGYNESYNIKHINPGHSILIQFDWISADFRIAALMSKDQSLLQSFQDSDPYTFIENELGGEVDRSSCKLQLLQAVYSLDLDDEIFVLFPQFKEWLLGQIDDLKINGYVQSILGRKFYSDGSIDENRSAINGIMQGSVAHAMNSVLYKVCESYGAIILTEQHDSLIIASGLNTVSSYVKSISEIMYRPFLPINDFTMPLKIHIGKHWGQYQYLRDKR